jgi:hypothetical protein
VLLLVLLRPLPVLLSAEDKEDENEALNPPLISNFFKALWLLMAEEHSSLVPQAGMAPSFETATAPAAAAYSILSYRIITCHEKKRKEKEKEKEKEKKAL